MTQNEMIIGITGYIASGKDTVAEYLINKGFNHYSHSDEIRAELKKRNMPSTRDSQFEMGNELRNIYGADYLAVVALQKSKKPTVITSIRVPAEVDRLRSDKDFYLIFVDAPIVDRYKRIISRAREGDEKLSFEDFKAQEEREMTSNDPHSQQLGKVAKMADKIIVNDKTKEDLYKIVEETLKEIENAQIN